MGPCHGSSAQAQASWSQRRIVALCWSCDFQSFTRQKLGRLSRGVDRNWWRECLYFLPSFLFLSSPPFSPFLFLPSPTPSFPSPPFTSRAPLNQLGGLVGVLIQSFTEDKLPSGVRGRALTENAFGAPDHTRSYMRCGCTLELSESHCSGNDFGYSEGNVSQ